MIERYHRKHWQEDGNSLSSRCFVSRITLPCPGGDEGWSTQELQSLPELTPPNIMPRLESLKPQSPTSTSPCATVQGQRWHLNSILLGSNPRLSVACKDHWEAQARLPSTQVCVNSSYITIIATFIYAAESMARFRQLLPCFSTGKSSIRRMPQVSQKSIFISQTFSIFTAGPSIESVSDNGNVDNDTCEEWERHEALHNDVQPNR